jgi:hypothetical protein
VRREGRPSFGCRLGDWVSICEHCRRLDYGGKGLRVIADETVRELEASLGSRSLRSEIYRLLTEPSSGPFLEHAVR